ncbi:MAG: 1-acyl-sn-glycerol-3-phosphate acyltransferase [Calditrichaeota bacterium]|nr:1-acyl-sn-glycerol-3-phosphate acyltransferase [Calditrichota bacterium]
MLGFLHQILFVTVLVVSTVVGAIFVILIGMFNPYASIISKIARAWSRLLLIAAGVRVTVKGREHIRPGQNYVVVGNHQSHMDIPVVFSYIPLHLTVVAKKELFRVPVFGWAIRAAGILRLDRQDRSQAIKVLNQGEQLLKEKHLSLLAFPEGTRSPDGTIRAFKKGPFVVAIKTGLPILPLTIIGTNRVLPKKSLWIRPGRVTLIIHPPVDPSGYTFDTRDQLVEVVRNIIIKGYEAHHAVVSESHRG